MRVLLLFALFALPACDECQRDIDCPSVKVCNDGTCEDPVCRIDEECPPDRRCSGNRCRLVDPAAPPEAADAIVLTPAG